MEKQRMRPPTLGDDSQLSVQHISNCVRCGGSPDEYLELSCNHRLCLECAARSVVEVSQRQSSRSDLTNIRCAICSKPTSLTPSTFKTLKGLVEPATDLHEDSGLGPPQLTKSDEQFGNFEDFKPSSCEENNSEFNSCSPRFDQKPSCRELSHIEIPNRSSLDHTTVTQLRQNDPMIRIAAESPERNDISTRADGQERKGRSTEAGQSGRNVRSKLLNTYINKRTGDDVSGGHERTPPKYAIQAPRENQFTLQEDNGTVVDASESLDPMSDQRIDEGMYCFTCQRGAVTSEELLDGIHLGHEVKHYKKAYPLLRAKIQEMRIKFDSHLEMLRLDGQKLNSKKEEVLLKGGEMKQMIYNTFKDIRKKLENKENELIEFAELDIRSKLNDIGKLMNEADMNTRKAKEIAELLARYASEKTEKDLYRIMTKRFNEICQIEEQISNGGGASKKINSMKLAKIQLKPETVTQYIEALQQIELEIQGNLTAGMNISERHTEVKPSKTNTAWKGLESNYPSDIKNERYDLSISTHAQKENHPRQKLLRMMEEAEPSIDDRPSILSGLNTLLLDSKKGPASRIEAFVQKKVETLGLTLGERSNSKKSLGNCDDLLAKIEQIRSNSSKALREKTKFTVGQVNITARSTTQSSMLKGGFLSGGDSISQKISTQNGRFSIGSRQAPLTFSSSTFAPLRSSCGFPQQTSTDVSVRQQPKLGVLQSLQNQYSRFVQKKKALF